MHLHDRHGAHLTLPARLKQAGQSPATGLNNVMTAGFPYRLSVRVNPMGLKGVFVSISLQPVTYIFQIRSLRRTTAN
jgi:hypothetical protein